MSFKAMADRHNKSVFLDTEKFADVRTVIYDGETYTDIPVLLTKLKEKDRRQLVTDHAQGLYLVTAKLHCALSDIGGVLPEKGMQIQVNDEEGGGGYFYKYRVAASGVSMGMVRLELEAVDE